MAAILKILVPEATKNYVENPSFRYDTTGWTTVGATFQRSIKHTKKLETVVKGVTISRTVAYKLYGLTSLEVITDGLAINEGVYYRVNDIAEGAKVTNEPVTASVYVRGEGRVRVRLWISGDNEFASDGIALSPLMWKRLEITGAMQQQNTDVRIYVETDGTAKATTFYVDGAQVERKSFASTYCDGDQPGCRWNVVDSASISSRNSYTREGGKWVQLAGPCRDNDDIYITVVQGMGIPPLQHNTQSWSQSAGSFFQNTKVLDRTATIIFNVKKTHKTIVKNIDASPIHELRQQLIDILKTDLTGGNEAFWFSYQEGEKELLFRMRYEAGLEGDWDIRNQWTNSFPVRFLVVDPYLVENNAHIQELKTQYVAHCSNILGVVNGEAEGMDTGLNGIVYKIERSPWGEIFAVGAFTKNRAGTTTLSRIAYWDGESWIPLEEGANDAIYSIAFYMNGDVFVTGAFTSIGGIAINRVAKWSRSYGDITPTWVGLGSGLDDTGYEIMASNDGYIYIGGLFHSAGGVTAYHVVLWDGISFYAMGANAGVDAYVVSMAKDPSNETIIYLAGQFLKNYSSGTNDLNYVAKYDRNTNLITALGSGVNNTVNSIRTSPSGAVYIGGSFTASGTTVLAGVARWTGSSWVSLGSGVTKSGGASIYSLEAISDNEIYAAGDFLSADGHDTIRYLTLWNGSGWVNAGATLLCNYPYCVRKFGNDLYIGGSIDYSATQYIAEDNDVYNYGTAEVYPTIYILGQGTVVYIENRTTKKRIYLNLKVWFAEEIFIDFGRKKMWSQLRPNLIPYLLPGSDFGDFTLVPGLNDISVLIQDDVSCQMLIYYQPRHWSADATVDAEEL